MQQAKMLITKADGEREAFDAVKLEHSLAHAGASSTTRARIVSHIMHELHPNIMTEDIYRHAFQLLQEHEETPIAARYSMKRAVFALGPSGFPFERFLAEVLKAEGWHTQTGVMMMGRCVSHEVDVLAEKAGKRVGIEAKFHNDPSGKTDVKDALYVKARYDDLKAAPQQSMRVDEGWLVTNTRFTRNAIRYAQCSNLQLIGWNYPRTRGLLSMIEEAKVHPLTCLTTLSEGEKRRLLEQKIVLCKSIQVPHLLQENGVKQSKIPQVIEEANRLCGI
ncbi:MAG: ATP-cone domain protein [Candidatus Kaiserbacteria bacterium]|nr:ATP-cone domain protein [Candidatus Kaiserbacteria bacterium]